MICKHCGFDADEESVRAEGSPCGVDNCWAYHCCRDAWIEHVFEEHNEDYQELVRLGSIYVEGK